MSDNPSPQIRDLRTPPKGVFSRHLQMWLMLGLAVLIMGIIVFSGRSEPPRQTVAVVPGTASGPIDVERVRAYEQRLAEQAATRQRAADAAARVESTPLVTLALRPPTDVTPLDTTHDEQHRRDAQSLFASNVAYTLRASQGERREPQASSAPDPVDANPPAPSEPVVRKERVSEGSVIEAVLTNRLDGSFSGPVNCLVTTPVFSADRQWLLIPAGARLLGSASKVQAWGESRLAVSFHRLLMPNGLAHSLESFPGLSQVGETGLHDKVDRHHWQVFGASIAIGALSGFAQWGTRADGSFGDEYRRSAGASLAESSGRVLDRYLNVLPTITIREGTRVKVYLTSDLELPPYDDGWGSPSRLPGAVHSSGGPR
jgi:type IV secretion system protein TrbI